MKPDKSRAFQPSRQRTGPVWLKFTPIITISSCVPQVSGYLTTTSILQSLPVFRANNRASNPTLIPARPHVPNIGPDPSTSPNNRINRSQRIDLVASRPCIRLKTPSLSPPHFNNTTFQVSTLPPSPNRVPNELPAATNWSRPALRSPPHTSTSQHHQQLLLPCHPRRSAQPALHSERITPRQDPAPVRFPPQ